MAKDITLKTRNGETRYPKTVTAIVYENGTGKTLQTIIEEMRQVDAVTNTRTQHFKADVSNLDTLKNKTDIGLYNYVGTGWRGSVSVCYDSADNVSQVALSSSTPSYNGNTLTWLSAQPCAMARTYTNGAWTHWEKVGAPVVNDLTTGGTDKALSAEMGKTLKDGLDALGPKIDRLYGYTNDHSSDEYTAGKIWGITNDEVAKKNTSYNDNALLNEPIAVLNGDSVVFSSKNNGDGYRGIFTSKAGVVLNTWAASSTVKEESYVAPQDGWLYLNRSISSDFSCVVSRANVQVQTAQLQDEVASLQGAVADIPTIKSKVIGIPMSIAFTDRSSWGGSIGETISRGSSNTNNSSTSYLSVVAGDRLRVNATTYPTYARTYLFTDNNDNIIATGLDVSNNEYVTVPSGATRMYFNNTITSMSSFGVYSMSEIDNLSLAIQEASLAIQEAKGNNAALGNDIKVIRNSYLAVEVNDGTFSIELPKSLFVQGNINSSGQHQSSNSVIHTSNIIIPSGSTLSYNVTTGYRIGISQYKADGSFFVKNEWYQGSGTLTTSIACESIIVTIALITSGSAFSVDDYTVGLVTLSTNKSYTQTRAAKASDVAVLLDNAEASRSILSVSHYTDKNLTITNSSRWDNNNGVVVSGSSGVVKRANAIAVTAGMYVEMIGEKIVDHSAGFLCDDSDNIVLEIVKYGEKTKVPSGATRLYCNHCPSTSSFDVTIIQGEIIDKIDKIEGELYSPTLAPSPQLPADDSSEADFNAEQVSSDEIYSAIESVIGKLPVPQKYYLLSKTPYATVYNVVGRDASNAYDIKAYVLTNRDRIAWKASSALYAWANGSTIVYTDNRSPRIGDNVYSDTSRTISTTVTSYDSATQSFVASGTTYTRDEGSNVDADVVFTRYNIGASATTAEVFNKRGTSLGTATVVNENAISYSSKTYSRYTALDYHTKNKATIVLWANEHGPQSDPMEPSIILYRMIKALCDGGCANNQFLQWLRRYCKIVFIPCANPYGSTRHSRNNSNNVNINRNYDCPGWSVISDTDKGSYAGSEPETQFIMNCFNEIMPNMAIDIHCLGYASQTLNEGRMHYAGLVQMTNELAFGTDTLMNHYGYTWTSYGNADPDNLSNGDSWITSRGVAGGLLEMNAGSYAQSYDGHQHGSQVIEACYSMLLNAMRIWLLEYEPTLNI